ncbi:hypothetical protein D9619_000678 [Psilocybe cf. subviscida]|uniref:Uncharacterized protein n=1 Tax=Psilocybe cf. subviscida TaxID=2480587 RepID=A0A8H5BDX8_9AGAR|nr:hypothetical protein D9619_000678 [Psilocybe cf. subviscida]
MNEPLKCAHTVVEYINSTTPWPRNLSSISNALRNYLPTSVDRVETTKLSSFAQPVYNEVITSGHSTPRFEVTGPKQVTDLIDTILSTVAILRVFAGQSKGEHQLMSTTLYLLRILGAEFFGNAQTIGGARFLLPRSMSADILKKNNFEGSTLLLVCASIDNTGHSSSNGCDQVNSYMSTAQGISTMEVDGNSSGSRLSRTDEEQDYSMGLYSDLGLTNSAQSKESPPTFLDIPLDGHVLPGRGHRTHCFLPVLCVADDHNINALVTAVTYQRFVWGIPLPTVGICLYTHSRSIFARIVPLVRLATSDSPFTNDPLRGVFDMLNPLSALLLSQFVLGLGSHVDAFCKAQRPAEMLRHAAYSMRLQLITKAPVGLHPGDLSVDAKVNQPHLEALCLRRMHPLKDLMLQRPLIREHQPTLLGSQPPGFTGSPQTKSEAALVIAEKRLKLDLWLALRATVILAVAVIPVTIYDPKTPFQQRVENMIPTYKSFTEPPDWKESWPDRLIPIPSDKPYITIRNKLMAQINQPELTRAQHDLNEREHASLLRKRRESDDIGFEVVTNQFTVLLFAVELAQQIHAYYMETQETGSCQPWDIILHLACCRLNQARGYGIRSGDILPERSIKLPRPAMSSKPQMRTLLEDQRSIARKQFSAQFMNRGSDSTATALNGIIARVDENLKTLSDASSQETLGTRGILNDMEPGRAVTDIIVSSPLDLNPGPSADQSQRNTKSELLHSISGISKRPDQSGKTKLVASSKSGISTPDSEIFLLLTTPDGDYKRNQSATDILQAKNQSTVHIISILSYLESLGLPDIPVFAVAGFAATGTILMAWRDKETE